MNWLKYLVGISAILVAGCAAFFSVTGLGLLFSGAAASVMVMAGTLEFAKLVAATYLKQEWDTIKGFNKWYLTIAVGTLMLITSAGIFGYLSNAFQQQNLSLQQVDREVAVYQTKIDQNTQQLAQLSQQANNFAQNQSTIVNKGNVNNRLLRSLDNRDKEIAKINNKISALQDSNAVANGKITEIKTKNIGLEREIGGFRFVAESFNAPLNTVVKFFIFIIVIVFDPLAVALIIAFNGLLMRRKEEKKQWDGSETLEQLDNYFKNTPKEEIDRHFNEIDKMYEIYGDNDESKFFDENGESTEAGDEMEDEINKMNEEILQKQNLDLSENDINTIIDNVENPPAPNEELKKAVEQYEAEVKKNSEPQIDEELANLQTDFSNRPIDLDGDGSIDGIDTDGDGMIDVVTAHPNRAPLVKDILPYYARQGFDWTDRKKWINDQNAVNYWIKYIKPNQYPTDFSSKSY